MPWSRSLRRTCSLRLRKRSMSSPSIVWNCLSSVLSQLSHSQALHVLQSAFESAVFDPTIQLGQPHLAPGHPNSWVRTDQRQPFVSANVHPTGEQLHAPRLPVQPVRELHDDYPRRGDAELGHVEVAQPRGAHNCLRFRVTPFALVSCIRVRDGHVGVDEPEEANDLFIGHRWS